jgi:hydrogenase maturation factor
MKTSYAATIAFALATLGTSHAFAADVSTQGITRAQVQTELIEAQRTGDIVDGHTGKKLNEISPSLYPAKAVAQGVTRAQVLAELTEAERTGDIVDGHTGKKLNELRPNLYPAKG